MTTETRSVDDQVEWMDDTRVIYQLTGGNSASDLWTDKIDNSGPAQLLVPSAYSPAVIRDSPS